MADNEPQAPEPLPAEEATKDSEAVKTDDDRYVGVDPIYKQSAYEEPLEVQAASRSKDDKAAVQGEVDMLDRVKRNEAGCVVGVDEVVPFEEWVEQSEIGLGRKGSVSGLDESRVEAGRAATEEAKDETGTIPPRSSTTHQPGANRVG